VSWLKVGMSVMATGLLAASLATAQVGESGRDRWQCADLDDYQSELVMSIPYDSNEMWRVMDAEDWDDVRLREYREASVQFEEWGETLETEFTPRNIPLAAREYHQALVDVVFLMADVSYVMGSGSGVWGLIGMTEQMETATLNMDVALELGNERCPTEWPFGEPSYEDEAVEPGSLGRREEAA
jgi:hypothetical protein